MSVRELLAHAHPQVVEDTHAYQERLSVMTDEALLTQLERLARATSRGGDSLRLMATREELLARMKEGTTLAYMHRGAK